MSKKLSFKEKQHKDAVDQLNGVPRETVEISKKDLAMIVDGLAIAFQIINRVVPIDDLQDVIAEMRKQVIEEIGHGKK